MGRPLTSVLVQGMSDTVWKVGCYRINPSTPSGQKFFILHMLVLPLIPITALVIQNSVTMNTLLGYQSRVSTIRRQVYNQLEKLEAARSAYLWLPLVTYPYLWFYLSLP